MNTRSGNAIVIILIAVFLFGALATVFMRGARTGQGQLTQHQANFKEMDLLDYAKSMERSVQKLLKKGCSENELDFGVAQLPDCEVNDDAPVDKSCSIFSANGGGLTPLDMTAMGFPSMIVSPSGGSAITGLGTGDNSGATEGTQDLVLWYANIDESLCRALDAKVGNTTPIVGFDAAGQYWCFGDNVAGTGNWGGSKIEDLDAERAARGAGCVNNTGTPSNSLHLPTGYNFFFLLHAR